MITETNVYVGYGLAAGAVALLAWPLLRRKCGRRSDAELLDAIIQRQSPSTGDRSPSTAGPFGKAPSRRGPATGGPTLAALEGHLRTAILNPEARERLVKDAVRTTCGDRATAIRKVLDDLYHDDKRWS